MSKDNQQDYDSLGQTQLRRSDALKHAVKWCDWPGAQASTVTEVARIFEHYLRTGNSPYDEDDEFNVDGEELVDVEDAERPE